MELLKERIRKDGKVKEGNVLKVDSFLNHQMDTELFREIGKEFKRRFAGEEVTKILTIEASGIGIACIAAEEFHVPVVFAKRPRRRTLPGKCTPPVCSPIPMEEFTTLSFPGNLSKKATGFCSSTISWLTERHWKG